MTIQTPLGVVRLGLSVGDCPIDSQALAETYRVSGNGWIASWRRAGLDVELLVCRPIFSPSLHMPVTDCWAALWRGKAKASCGPLVFTATWEEGYSWDKGGPDGGQHLHAWTWGDGQTNVTVGTQDDEMLTSRVAKNDYLPPQWANNFPAPYRAGNHQDSAFWQHPIHNQLRPLGIACPLPSLEDEQEFQVQFGVAWTNADDFSAVASCAVEASPTEILAGGGCS